MPSLNQTGGVPLTVVSASMNNQDRETGGNLVVHESDFGPAKTVEPEIMSTNQPNTVNSGFQYTPSDAQAQKQQDKISHRTSKTDNMTDMISDQERAVKSLEDNEAKQEEEKHEVSSHLRNKVIKKRIRNKYGRDTRHMGFEKRYVINEQTGRAN